MPYSLSEIIVLFLPIHLLAGYGKLATARLKTIILPTGILIWPLLSGVRICRYDDFDYYLSVPR